MTTTVPPQNTTARAAGGAKPRVCIGNEADALDDLVRVMRSEDVPSLYIRSGGLCWITEDEGRPVIRQLNPDNLRAYFAEHVYTFKRTKDRESGEFREDRMPVMRQTCATILGRQAWSLPRLAGLATSPVLRRDGSLVQDAGYDRATGLYLVPMHRLPPIPESPDVETLRWARDLLLDKVLADFPWVQRSDKAQYVASLFIPLMRNYVDGPTPMWIITAGAPGSGKTMLTTIHKELHGMGDAPWPENDAELRKAITANLRDNAEPVITFDNLPSGYTVRTALLADLMTKATWRDRVLGSTETVTMPNNRLWMFTGNNLRTGGDLARRTVWVRLDPDCPNPDRRSDFALGDLDVWLKCHSTELLQAVLVLLRGWIAAGAQRSDVRMGSFSAWASALGGLLGWLDLPGWLEDRDTAMAQMDEETEEWHGFLATWIDTLGDTPRKTGELVISSELAEVVPRLKNGDLPSAKQLGMWLKSREGRYYGDLKLASKYDSNLKSNRWRVVRYAGSKKAAAPAEATAIQGELGDAG
ncbi:hypothetical protein FCH28_37525 [Streptomyces piniterrae]|uniref:Uncharacterized protein n=1 Tax=Streptomyces piniterrae TaxID=2571125 RepID=A0A4U0MKK9_9ACTN|nr:hypothetical protein [Streptomyces piniterrae]TJZ41190.1 hypothetical protein FCH28_37525 [Streptomyces piniterrae]